MLGLAHVWQNRFSGHFSPHRDGHWCPHSSCMVQLCKHGVMSQGTAHASRNIWNGCGAFLPWSHGQLFSFNKLGSALMPRVFRSGIPVVTTTSSIGVMVVPFAVRMTCCKMTTFSKTVWMLDHQSTFEICLVDLNWLSNAAMKSELTSYRSYLDHCH